MPAVAPSPGAVQEKDAKVQHAEVHARRESDMAAGNDSVLEHRNSLLREQLAEAKADAEGLQLQLETAQEEAVTLRRRNQQLQDGREDDAQEIAHLTRSLAAQTELAQGRGRQVAELEEALRCAEQRADSSRPQPTHDGPLDTEGAGSGVAPGGSEREEALAREVERLSAAVRRLAAEAAASAEAHEAARAASAAETTRMQAAAKEAEGRASELLEARNRLYRLHQEYKGCHEAFARDAQRVQVMRLDALERLTRDVHAEKEKVADFEHECIELAAANEQLRMQAAAAANKVADLLEQVADTATNNRRLQQSVRQQEKKLATDHSSQAGLLARLREHAEAERQSREENMRLQTITEQQKKLIEHLQTENEAKEGRRGSKPTFNVPKKLRAKKNTGTVRGMPPVAECAFCPTMKLQLAEMNWRLRNAEMAVVRLEMENDGNAENTDAEPGTLKAGAQFPGGHSTLGRSALGPLDTNQNLGPVVGTPTKASDVEPVTEGWLKMLDERSDAQGWRSVWLSLTDTAVQVFDDCPGASSTGTALLLREMDVSPAENKLRVRGVLAGERPATVAEMDLKFAFELEFSPMCLPQEHLLFLAPSEV